MSNTLPNYSTAYIKEGVEILVPLQAKNVENLNCKLKNKQVSHQRVENVSTFT